MKKKSDWTRKMLEEAVLDGCTLTDPFLIVKASNKELCDIICEIQTESYAEGCNWFGNSVYDEMDAIITKKVEIDMTSMTTTEITDFLKEKEKRLAMFEEIEKEND